MRQNRELTSSSMEQSDFMSVSKTPGGSSRGFTSHPVPFQMGIGEAVSSRLIDKTANGILAPCRGRVRLAPSIVAVLLNSHEALRFGQPLSTPGGYPPLKGPSPLIGRVSVSLSLHGTRKGPPLCLVYRSEQPHGSGSRWSRQEPLVPTPQTNICIHRTTLENKFRDEISE